MVRRLSSQRLAFFRSVRALRAAKWTSTCFLLGNFWALNSFVEVQMLCSLLTFDTLMPLIQCQMAKNEPLPLPTISQSFAPQLHWCLHSGGAWLVASCACDWTTNKLSVPRLLPTLRLRRQPGSCNWKCRYVSTWELKCQYKFEGVSKSQLRMEDHGTEHWMINISLSLARSSKAENREIYEIRSSVRLTLDLTRFDRRLSLFSRPRPRGQSPRQGCNERPGPVSS